VLNLAWLLLVVITPFMTRGARMIARAGRRIG
jgi:hypothetical protein